MHQRISMFLFVVLLITVLFGCTNKTPSPQTITNPPITVASTPMPISTATATIAPQIQDRPAFGRYVAILDQTLYYTDGSEILTIKNNKPIRLLELPKDLILEDIYIEEPDVLYFSMIETNPESIESNRKLYKAAKTDNFQPKLIANHKGPMLAKNNNIYFIENGLLMSLDTKSGIKKEMTPLDKKTQLIDWGYFDGKTLYYEVFDTMEPDGTLYGQSKLYRLDLTGMAKTMIGERNKPMSGYLLYGDAIIYSLKPNADGKSYVLTIIDSPEGPINTVFSIPKNILGDGPGREHIYVLNQTAYLLLSNPASGSDTTLSVYKLDKGSPEIEAWSISSSQSAGQFALDRSNNSLYVLYEASKDIDYTLTSYDLVSGKILGNVNIPADNNNTIKKMIVLNGSVLLYSLKGEDYPRPELIYLSMDNI